PTLQRWSKVAISCTDHAPMSATSPAVTSTAPEARNAGDPCAGPAGGDADAHGGAKELGAKELGAKELGATDLDAMDLDPYWMPFTHNRYFKARRPADRMLVAAEGAYYTTSAGQKLFDGLSGLWCSGLGHGDVRIKDAVKRQ